MDDVRAVLDAVVCERAALVGVSEGGTLSAMFAATYPERTRAVVMIGSRPRVVTDATYPWGVTAEARDAYLEEIPRAGAGRSGSTCGHRAAAATAFREWWATYLRMDASPGAAYALGKMNTAMDVREVLPSSPLRGSSSTAPATARSGSARDATPPRVSRARASSSCRETTTCRSSATRKRSSTSWRSS